MLAGDLSRESGLAPASITGLLDRLTRKGVARRVPHPHDGRRFLVEVDPGHIEAGTRMFEQFVASIRDLCANYSAAELDLVRGFIAEAAKRQQDAVAGLSAPADSSTEDPGQVVVDGANGVVGADLADDEAGRLGFDQ